MAPHRRPKIRPRLRTAVATRPHPSGRGRSDGYAHDFRLAAFQTQYNNGNGNAVMVALLRNQRLWPSRRTLRRWRLRFLLLGHIRRFRRTGNRRATVLRGAHLINFTSFLHFENLLRLPQWRRENLRLRDSRQMI